MDSFSGLVAAQPGYRRWGARVRGARPRPPPGRPLARGRRRPRAAAGHLRRLAEQPADEWLAVDPELRFKLDASDSWTDEVVAELASTGAVDVVDLKGLYDGDWVDATPSAELYGRVAAAFPEAWLEDARISDETRAVLEQHRDRLTWDFPIHSVADVDALEWEPLCLNSKPSRFGSVRSLFDSYDPCEERGSRSTAAASSSSAPAAGRSST